MSLEPGELYLLKAGVLECVAEQVALTAAGLPDRMCVVPGAEVAWDDCECGQLTVHHTNLFPSQRFPDIARDPPFTKCAPNLWVVELAVTLVRCVPSGRDDARPPACSELDGAAVIQDADIEAMQRGVACCLEGRMHRFGEHRPVGPGGMCVGSELRVLAGLGNCAEVCP